MCVLPHPQALPLHNSRILSAVAGGRRAAFLHALTAEWLPAGKSYRLLYRASRDGKRTTDFHFHCDDQGPTLVIAESRLNHAVFGGYAGVSWGYGGVAVPCPDAFLFSVVSPHGGAGVVKFPLKPGVDAALGHDRYHGPWFLGGLDIRCCEGYTYAALQSYCAIGEYFEDPGACQPHWEGHL